MLDEQIRHHLSAGIPDSLFAPPVAHALQRPFRPGARRLCWTARIKCVARPRLVGRLPKPTLGNRSRGATSSTLGPADLPLVRLG